MTDELAGAIRLPDGTAVRGRGLSAPLPPEPLPTFGLYIGRPPGEGERRRFDPFGRVARNWRPDWPAEWIDWPDFRTPRYPELAAASIHNAYLLARDGERVEVACTGGQGRTGTVIACMAVLAGHPVDDAVGWTRRNYRPKAVETPGQRRWVAWFAANHPGLAATAGGGTGAG